MSQRDERAGAPAYGKAVTPSDTTDIAPPTRGLYCGVGGDVKVDFLAGDSAVLLKNLVAGIVHPLQVTRVYSTDTAATNIVALY